MPYRRVISSSGDKHAGSVQSEKHRPQGKPGAAAGIDKAGTHPGHTYRINTRLRMAHFLSQVAHESGGFHSMEESLNYKVEALTAKFSKRITAEQAKKFGRDDATKQKANQQEIANIIYGGEWGKKHLGNTEPGDGYKFRGRGLIQLTGRTTYTAFADSMKMSLDAAVAYAATPEGAVRSAAWFWATHGLNALADSDHVITVTKRINGGTNGLDDRIKYLNRAKTWLPAPANTTPVLAQQWA